MAAGSRASHRSCKCGPRVAVVVWLVCTTVRVQLLTSGWSVRVQVWELVAEHGSKAMHDAWKVGRVCFDGLGSDAAVSANGSPSATKHQRPTL